MASKYAYVGLLYGSNEYSKRLIIYLLSEYLY